MFCSQYNTDLVRITWTIIALFDQINTKTNTFLSNIILCGFMFLLFTLWQINIRKG